MTKFELVQRENAADLDADEEIQLVHTVLNCMEQGILVWDQDTKCQMFNSRLFEVLELEPTDLYPGKPRVEFLNAAVERGEFNAETAKAAEARFHHKQPFQFDRQLPSGRVIFTNARPLRDGGFVVTFTDVSDMRNKEKELAKAKATAENAERSARQALVAEQTRQTETILLTQLNEWLQTCKSLEELYKIVAAFMKDLIPKSKGELYIFSNSRDVLDGVCSWGGAKFHNHIQPDSCWGLRRGRHYKYGSGRISFPCDHVIEQVNSKNCPDFICVPIVAHGDTVGLLHIKFNGTPGDYGILDAGDFAVQCGEHISLAVANVKLRDELHDQSSRDPLTRLYNRRYLLDAFRSAISAANREKTSLGFISFDADKFKSFNDDHGHDAGDEVLRKIAETMQDLFAINGVPCRFGGEEFVVLLPDSTKEQTMEQAEALRRAVEAATVPYMGRPLPKVTISAGVAVYPEDGTTSQAIIKAADNALYQAKDEGRNRVISC